MGIKKRNYFAFVDLEKAFHTVFIDMTRCNIRDTSKY